MIPGTATEAAAAAAVYMVSWKGLASAFVMLVRGDAVCVHHSDYIQHTT